MRSVSVKASSAMLIRFCTIQSLDSCEKRMLYRQEGSVNKHTDLDDRRLRIALRLPWYFGHLLTYMSYSLH